MTIMKLDVQADFSDGDRCELHNFIVVAGPLFDGDDIFVNISNYN